MRAASVLVGVTLSYGQAPAKLQFEVASVRMIQGGTKPPGNFLSEFNFGPLSEMEDVAVVRQSLGVGATHDPNRIMLPYVPMAFVVQLAFGTLGGQSTRLQGPDWMDDQDRVYTIEAITPAGTTGPQAREMVRNLLMDRFGMRFHTETRRADVYEITVDEKLPLKLKQSAGPATAPPDFKPKRDPDGIPTFPPGVTKMFILPTHARLQAVNLPISEVARRLSAALKAEVIDKTGLTGKYDLQLDFDPGLNSTPPPDIQPAPPLDKALRSLGLALTKKKGDVQVTVIDALNKTPSEN